MNRSAAVILRARLTGRQVMPTEQMFLLIDTTLSFEACLYHQVLPLALEDSCLKLGMVNPEDTAALDYVGRILSYMNLSLVSHPIDPETHRAMLSAYLNYTRTSQPATEQVQSALCTDSPAAEATAQLLGEETAIADTDAESTLIWHQTEALDIQSTNQDSQIPTPAPTAPLQSNDSQELNQVAQPLPLWELLPNSNLPVLEVQAAHLSSPVEVLATLPAQNLLQELLARVLAGGIGRLYFEREFSQQGRIIWSQDGDLQFVLEELPLPVFQEMINELKRLTHLSLVPVQEPLQVEIECLYNQDRLLLRLRVMPGMHGEEATLQVLRGAALKFYQQQQLSRLSRDALGIAQQLQGKLNELRERAYLNSTTLSSGQLEALPALNQLLENVDQQLKALKELQSQPPDDNKLG